MCDFMSIIQAKDGIATDRNDLLIVNLDVVGLLGVNFQSLTEQTWPHSLESLGFWIAKGRADLLFDYF